MALKIRFRQQGRANRQTYRLVVADERSPRDGKYIEMLGWYNPVLSENNICVNNERAQYWLSQGAQISDQAKAVIKKVAPEVIGQWQEKKNAQQVVRAKKRRGVKA